MNTNTKAVIFAALATASIAITVKDFYNIRKQAIQDRKKIEENLNLDLSSIHEARDRMLDRIDAGKYDALTGDKFEQVMTDLKFFTIVAREGK